MCRRRKRANTYHVQLVRVALRAEQDARHARVSVAGGRVQGRVAVLARRGGSEEICC